MRLNEGQPLFRPFHSVPFMRLSPFMVYRIFFCNEVTRNYRTRTPIKWSVCVSLTREMALLFLATQLHKNASVFSAFNDSEALVYRVGQDAGIIWFFPLFLSFCNWQYKGKLKNSLNYNSNNTTPNTRFTDIQTF